MTQYILTALALGSCAALPLLTQSACTDSNAEQAALQDTKAPTIKTFPIQQARVTDYGEWFSYLHGQKDTDIHPRVGGFLVSQDYKDGTYVKEGDVLFRIDPALFEAELARAKANLQAAEAGLSSAEASREQAQLDVARYEQLVKTHAVSEKDLNDTRQHLKAATAAVDAAKASVNQNKAAVNKAQINLDYTVVRAPYDGIIGTALASKGELVGPATKLANITSVNPIRVDFSINSDMLIPAFRDMAKAKPQPPPLELIMEDGSTYPHKGSIKAMEAIIADSGLIDIEGEVPNPDGILRGGMPVRVRIPLSQHEALLVPKDAVRTVLRNSFIIVVDKQHVPHMVPVTVTGTYDIPVTEADGFSSTQPFIAVEGYNNQSLSETLKGYGYEQATEALEVADPLNGVHAMKTTSANSRLAEGEKPGTVDISALSFKPENPQVAAMAALKAQEQAKKSGRPAPKPTIPPFVVKVAPLLQQDVEIKDEWFGSLRGVEETSIRPKVSGFIKSQNFKDGSIVKQWDVLFSIDPAPYEAARDEAKANLEAARAAREQAKAQLEKSEYDYDRYNKLNASSPGAISDKTVTDAATAVQTNRAALLKAEATAAQMEAALHLAEINLGYTTITAPFTGRAGIRKASIGDLVSPEDAQPLVTLSSVEPMRVDFNINGKIALAGLTKLTQGDEQRKQANPGVDKFDIVLEDGSTYPSKGQVVSADNTLSKTMGTLKVVGQVDNKDGILRSGMPVRVRASIGMQKGAWLVPARAPLNANGQDMLVLLKPDKTPAMLPIQKGSIVNIPVTGADGKTMVQPMQIVQFNPQALVAQGIASPNEVQVIVEGSLTAAQSFGENMKLGAAVNTLTPVPFQYTVPQPVVPSITAGESPHEAQSGNSEQN